MLVIRVKLVQLINYLTFFLNLKLSDVFSDKLIIDFILYEHEIVGVFFKLSNIFKIKLFFINGGSEIHQKEAPNKFSLLVGKNKRKDVKQMILLLKRYSCSRVPNTPNNCLINSNVYTAQSHNFIRSILF